MLNRRAFIIQSGAFSLAAASGFPRTSAYAQAAATRPGMIVHRGMPLNAEPRLALLRKNFITPQQLFYIRNHGTIPRLDAGDYRLRVGGLGMAPLELSLADLRSRFPQKSIKAVLQCAGNRRVDMVDVKYVSGDAWQPGAISNAEWTGVALGDVLRAAKISEEPNLHVAFTGHDEIHEEGEHFHFGVSIPLKKAMASETLLAFAMNGEPLTAEHGFPIRVVTPGYAGVRSPKWLATINVQHHQSDNHIQRKEYKLFPPDITKETAVLSEGKVINTMPLNSAICDPAEDATVRAGMNVIRGYAIATATRIRRVEVSGDGGASWHPAVLEPHANAPWSWTFWSTQLALQPGPRRLVVRAFDDAGETQPASTADIWNYPGYLSRAWHRVDVHVT